MPYLDHYLAKRNERLLKGKGKTARLIVKGEQRRHMIDVVMDDLKDWRSSPFENESACRAGLRSGLCLKGVRWSLADLEAESLIAECLRSMGAARPTWGQGQREYAEPRENCAWCGNALPEDLAIGGYFSRYCSEGCARSTLLKRDFAARTSADRSYQAVYEAIRRLRAAPRECTECGKSFRPKLDSQHLCSTDCRAKSKIMIEERPCLSCGIVYKPTSSQNSIGRGKFCSVNCKADFQRTQVFKATCEFCAAPFKTGSKHAKFCSKACTMTSFRMERGMLPKRLKAHIFDHLFIARAPQPSAVNLTAEIFDGWFQKAA